MDDYLQWALPLAAVVILLLAWLVIRRRRRGGRLERVLNEISHDRVHGIVLPNGDEGEIQIDHLLLTSKGLLIVDIKDVVGTVFGSDKMQDWTVISDRRRYTFQNPQAALYDRVASVRHIVRQVPVEGRLVFLDAAEFTKGVPSLVTGLDELLAEFGEPDSKAAKVQVEAFRPHWEQLCSAAAGQGAAMAEASRT